MPMLFYFNRSLDENGKKYKSNFESTVKYLEAEIYISGMLVIISAAFISVISLLKAAEHFETKTSKILDLIEGFIPIVLSLVIGLLRFIATRLENDLVSYKIKLGIEQGYISNAKSERSYMIGAYAPRLLKDQGELSRLLNYKSADHDFSDDPSTAGSSDDSAAEPPTARTPLFPSM